MTRVNPIDDCLSRQNGHLFIEECDAMTGDRTGDP